MKEDIGVNKKEEDIGLEGECFLTDPLTNIFITLLYSIHIILHMFWKL